LKSDAEVEENDIDNPADISSDYDSSTSVSDEKIATGMTNIQMSTLKAKQEALTQKTTGRKAAPFKAGNKAAQRSLKKLVPSPPVSDDSQMSDTDERK
jgi:hypothetical protein